MIGTGTLNWEVLEEVIPEEFPICVEEAPGTFIYFRKRKVGEKKNNKGRMLKAPYHSSKA